MRNLWEKRGWQQLATGNYVTTVWWRNLPTFFIDIKNQLENEPLLELGTLNGFLVPIPFSFKSRYVSKANVDCLLKAPWE